LPADVRIKRSGNVANRNIIAQRQVLSSQRVCRRACSQTGAPDSTRSPVPYPRRYPQSRTPPDIGNRSCLIGGRLHLWRDEPSRRAMRLRVAICADRFWCSRQSTSTVWDLKARHAALASSTPQIAGPLKQNGDRQCCYDPLLCCVTSEITRLANPGPVLGGEGSCVLAL